MDKIDFVILWVDGYDPKWSKLYKEYAAKELEGDKRIVRFRDWDNLQYWFRSIEQNAPWVNKIHFVTFGHLPNWLNVNHPKINIVYHDDIFPDKSYLPVFNSRAIEVNLFRIPGLSEKFVYFNDDMFLLNPAPITRFFQNRKPVDIGIMNVVSATNDLSHVLINNIKVISKYYGKRECIKKNLFKWINPIYGKNLFRNIVLLMWPNFTGFYEPHQPSSLLKSTFEDVWKKEEKALLATSKTRFKADHNLNQYVFKYWQLVNGNFTPTSGNDSLMIELETEADCIEASKIIENGRIKLLCLNDTNNLYSFEGAKMIIKNSLDSRWPLKSSFEK